MGYVFKEKITFSEYEKFIKNYKYLPFMQEYNWAKSKEYENILIIGVYENNKLCATGQIIIKKKKRDNLFFVPQGFLLDYTNKELVTFLTNNLKLLARKYHAYVVDLYPCLSTMTPNYDIIHNNLLQNNYKWTNDFIDKSESVLISLYNGKKKITKTELKKKYDKSDFYSKRGITFEISTNMEDIKRMQVLIDDDYFDSNLVGNLLVNFNNRVKMIFAKIDLVLYRNYLKEKKAKKEEITNIDELIASQGESMNIGCSLIILPYNKKDVCEYIYNIEIEFNDDLDITHGMIYEAMKEAQNYDCSYLKISDIDLECEKYIDKYQAIPINYIGHYSLVINKLLYFLNKEIKKKGRN